jgi:hypothetical protein
VERTSKRIALFLTSIAMSAAARGGSTPSTTPAATVATAPQTSVQASAAPTSASPSAADTPPSVAPTTKLTWTFGGSLPSGWTEDEGTFSRSENASVEVLTDRSLMAANCVLGPQPASATPPPRSSERCHVGPDSRRQPPGTSRSPAFRDGRSTSRSRRVGRRAATGGAIPRLRSSHWSEPPTTTTSGSTTQSRRVSSTAMSSSIRRMAGTP